MHVARLHVHYGGQCRVFGLGVHVLMCLLGRS